MPSNKDLREQANELASFLGLEIEMTGLKNDELVALVSDLKAKKKDAGNPAAEAAMLDFEEGTTDESGPMAAEEAAVEAIDEKGSVFNMVDTSYNNSIAFMGHLVAPGKAVTTLRGIKAEGAEVSAKDFVGGQKTLDSLVKTGHVVEG